MPYKQSSSAAASACEGKYQMCVYWQASATRRAWHLTVKGSFGATVTVARKGYMASRAQFIWLLILLTME